MCLLFMPCCTLALRPGGGVPQKHMAGGAQQGEELQSWDEVQILALPPACCVTLHKSSTFSLERD